MLLAYKYVLVAVMLAEVNFCAENLHLRVKLPVSQEDLRVRLVAPPDVMRFGGRLETDDYFFGFSGRLRLVVKIRPFGSLTVAEQKDVLSTATSLIGTNEAYSLATNWLAAMSVDVSLLEQTNRVAVRQRVAGGTGRGPKKLLPIFYVTWIRRDRGMVSVSIDGRNKELLELTLDDESFASARLN